MTEPIVYRMPRRIVAGSSVTYRRELGDYPASAWDLSLYLKGKGSLVVEANADGDTHVVEITALETAGLHAFAGIYRAFERVEEIAGERVITLPLFTVEVLPDPAQAAAGDLQPFAEKIVEILESAFAGTLTRDQASFQIDGVAVQFIGIDERRKILAFYRNELRRLKGRRGIGRAVNFTFGNQGRRK